MMQLSIMHITSLTHSLTHTPPEGSLPLRRNPQSNLYGRYTSPTPSAENLSPALKIRGHGCVCKGLISGNSGLPEAPRGPEYFAPYCTADKPGVFYFLDFGGEERGRVHDESE